MQRVFIIDANEEQNLSSGESEIIDDTLEPTVDEQQSIPDTSFKNLNLDQDLTSSIPVGQLEKHLIVDESSNDHDVSNICPRVGAASDEWMKAKRLIKVAGLFQKRLNKRVRSLSDPQIEIPNEFVSGEN